VAIPTEYGNPKTYFDFSRDFLFAGCEGCDDYFTPYCSRCDWAIRRGDSQKVDKLLIQYGQREESELRDPFGYASDRFPEAREIMVFSPLTKISESEKQWNTLYENSVPLPWQEEGQTLMEYYVAYGRHRVGWQNEWKAERVTRVDFCDRPSGTAPCKESH
jgi:hypothetical protein